MGGASGCSCGHKARIAATVMEARNRFMLPRGAISSC
jgi:hypothetical protein